MNNSQASRLAVIAGIATSLLAVGVVTAISMTEEADAQLRNRLSQSNSATVNQNGASNSATVTQSNTASQSGGSSSSSSSSTVCRNGDCTTTTTPLHELRNKEIFQG